MTKINKKDGGIGLHDLVDYELGIFHVWIVGFSMDSKMKHPSIYFSTMVPHVRMA